MPEPDEAAAARVAARQAQLTKPVGSLGLLEDLVAWLARWQRRDIPQLERINIAIFAGNHGVTIHDVSPYPASVTAQMVANFERGGAAINQIAQVLGATLSVFPLDLDHPTADFTQAAAMSQSEFSNAVNAGYDAVLPGTDLLCLGEMGIGNTTIAAALSAALFGGAAETWAGRGTGLDAAGVAHKAAVIDQAFDFHAGSLSDPWEVARRLGGRETAAILGAVLGARRHGIPVVLDGFVCTAAVAPLVKLLPQGLDHCVIGHVSAEAGHQRLVQELHRPALLNLGMRLGEGAGAALAAQIIRSALACHSGMATFAAAGVSERV